MKKILIIMGVLGFFFSCTNDNLEDLHPATVNSCDTTNVVVSFANDILPIMINSCGGDRSVCHQTDASMGGYGLADYTMVTATIVNAGNDLSNPNAFIDCITHSDPNIANMPDGGGKLSDCSIKKIQAWLNRGQLNN
jgi:hypothetical protein